MLQESTTTLLIKLVQSLESAGEAGWDDQIEFGKECLYEMHQMTRPSFKAYKMPSSDARWPTHLPSAAKLNRAMPHVKDMVKAIRCRDHATAVVSGKAALAEMRNSSVAPVAVAESAVREPETKVAPVAPLREKATRRHTAAVARKKSPRHVRVARGK